MREISQNAKNVAALVQDMLQEAYAHGVEDERKRLWVLVNQKRESLNYSRGGSYCEKPYLQPVNAKIEFCDELLKDIIGRLPEQKRSRKRQPNGLPALLR